MIKKHHKRKGTPIPNINNLSIDQQHLWYNEFKIDSVELGLLCSQFPALKNSWKQFKTVYKMCKAEHENNRTISELVG